MVEVTQETYGANINRLFATLPDGKYKNPIFRPTNADIPDIEYHKKMLYFKSGSLLANRYYVIYVRAESIENPTLFAEVAEKNHFFLT